MSTHSETRSAGASTDGTSLLARLDGVSKRFGATLALDGVSLAIEPGHSRALVGRNGAGKSTVVGVLTGITRPDEGAVTFGGAPAPAPGDREAWQERVACVYQRPTIVPHLTVAENIFLNAPVGRRNLISWKRVRERARAELDAWEMDVGVNVLAGELPIDQRQIVEIIRALRRGSRLIILDEPTAQLESREIDQLFERIKRLQAAGITFLYISHHLSEIAEVCDCVTVLRDGRLVGDGPLEDWPERRIVSAMVGDEAQPAETSASPVAAVGSAGAAVAAKAGATGEVVLEVEGLSLEGEFAAVDLTLRAGECVGVAGLVGSGKNAFAESLAGLVRPDSGTVRVAGKPLRFGRTRRSIDAGIGFVPEDRHHSGFVATMSVAENLTMSLAGMGRAGWVRSADRDRASAALIDELSIKASPHQPASDLSGGNQQKVVLGRALATGPRVLVLVHPTAGVDIASKDVIFDVVTRARRDGLAVLLVSDELDELRRCERVQVMFAGRIVSEVKSKWERSELVAAIEGVGNE